MRLVQVADNKPHAATSAAAVLPTGNGAPPTFGATPPQAKNMAKNPTLMSALSVHQWTEALDSGAQSEDETLVSALRRRASLTPQDVVLTWVNARYHGHPSRLPRSVLLQCMAAAAMPGHTQPCLGGLDPHLICTLTY